MRFKNITIIVRSSYKGTITTELDKKSFSKNICNNTTIIL